MSGIWLGITAVLGFIAVALGSFGAHALKGRVDDQALGWWQTAVQYQFVHVLALFGVVLLAARSDISGLGVVRWCLIIGIMLFCGSLYAMTLGAPRWLGAITPIGGILWLIAWFWLAVIGFRMQ